MNLPKNIHLVLLWANGLICSLCANAQKDMHWTWSGQGQLGASVMLLDSGAAPDWNQSMGTHFTLATGLGFRYGHVLGAEVNFGMHFVTMDFNTQGASYSVINYNLAPGATAFGLLPLSDKHRSFVRLGLEYARLFQNDSRLEHEKVGDRFVFDSFKHQRNYWTPTIGIAKWEERSVFSINAGYYFTTHPAYLTRMTIAQSNGNYAVYKGKGNALTLSFNYARTIGTSKKSPEEKIKVPLDAQELMSRPVRQMPALHSRKRHVYLQIWDNGDLDQDSVSIYLNGEFVLANYALTKHKKRLRLELHEGENRLLFIAHNEGLFPPNTAHCRVKLGRRRKLLTVASDLESNAGLVIVVD